MREASQRERVKGGSAYAESMEPALESCMNPCYARGKYSVHRR